jgi:hypothetical protein
MCSGGKLANGTGASGTAITPASTATPLPADRI